MNGRLHQALSPTVESCPYRRELPASGSSWACGLVASLTLIDDLQTCAVTDEVCAACCESFPASPERLNPVVASLLYRVVSRVMERHGTGGCDATLAQTLKQRAEESLDLIHRQEERLTPARTLGSCLHLGPPIDATHDATRGSGAVSRVIEPTHQCRHPDHGTTTESGCRRCRDWIGQPSLSRAMRLEELVPPYGQRSGTPVRRWAVGVTTAPRRQPTLESCLDSLARAGWEDVRLFLDGAVRIPPRYSHLPITCREQSLGGWPSWYLALTELLVAHPDADAILLLQDDAWLHDRHCLREYLERMLWPGESPGVVSLYFAGPAGEPGWHRCQEGTWAPLAMVLPREIARAFVNEPFVSGCLWEPPGKSPSPDAVLGSWTYALGIGLWYPVPSLVQHIGNTSIIWGDSPNAGYRRASWFTGAVETPFAVGDSLDAFPEGVFPCSDAHRAEHEARVDRGRSRMQEASAVICGLCRDVRHFLPRLAARVQRLGGMFRDYQVVLFESDSRDASLEFLGDWQRHNPRIHVLHETMRVPRFPQVRTLERASHMARCRNQYRNYLVDHFGDFDYAIVVDTDLGGGWSYDGIANTFGHDDWDFVGSYGLERWAGRDPYLFPYVHFDTWAFRPAPPPHPQIDDARMLVLHRGEPMLRVNSCFGGLGVYRMACMRECAYGGSDLEHAVLHEEMRHRGLDRLFLNPSQIVLYSPH